MARALLFAELVLQMEIEDQCDMAMQDYLRTAAIRSTFRPFGQTPPPPFLSSYRPLAPLSEATQAGGYREFAIFMRDVFPRLYYANKLAGDRAELNAFRIAPADALWENAAAMGAIERAVRDGEPYEEEPTPDQTLTEILAKRKRRIAQVALWNVSTPHTRDVINKLWYGPSHEAATALYQVPGCLFLLKLHNF